MNNVYPLSKISSDLTKISNLYIFPQKKKRPKPELDYRKKKTKSNKYRKKINKAKQNVYIAFYFNKINNFFRI